MSTLEILTSLKDINTRYSVFEADQVLTHIQLNSIAAYLSDQTRLSRIQLLGVGIGAGLNISLEDNLVTVTPGIGITTDGDLLHIKQTKVFDRFKPYDQSKPRYELFYNDDTMIPVYELVNVEATDDEANGLSQFETDTGQLLSGFVALLLMESYLKDDDLCSGTDCDNLGQDYIDSVKVLLIDQASLELLNTTLPTAHNAYEQLDEIVAERPVIGSTLESISVSEIVTAYRRTNLAIRNQLDSQLSQLWSTSAAILRDVFPNNPNPGWQTRLNTINSNFDNQLEITGIQYYYDFLKDLVETYNQFRELLFEEFTWLCPDTNRFPKHLLLGNLVSESGLEQNRTPFYPSPLISQTNKNLNHAKFLAKKIDILIQTFKTPDELAADNLDVLITPSRSEEFPLEERAIPYYYADTAPIHQHWNYQLHRRRMDTYNYSYNAAERYQARGGAADPLGSQLGKYRFFRIEGHLGKPAEDVLETLESLTSANNLPFTVQAVMAGTEKTDLIPRKKFKYTDLHRFHYLLRQDVSNQLNEVANFSDQFKQLVDASVDDEDNAASLKALANQKNEVIGLKNLDIQAKLNLPFTNYQANSGWQSDLGDATRTAGEFKSNLSAVVKTDFSTPFDTLISHTPVKWIGWLDSILQTKEEKEEEQKLFHKFIAQHPGLEHFGGVSRGGTFVLVYNAQKTVVADFMLPYAVIEPTEEPDEEPALTDAIVKPSFVLNTGIKVNPSLEKFVDTSLTTYYVNTIQPDLEPRFSVQDQYFEIFKGSAELIGNTVQQGYLDIAKESFNVITETVRVQDPKVKGFSIADDLLAAQTQEIETVRQATDLYRKRAKQPGLDEEKRGIYETRAKASETKLAQLITETADYLQFTNTDVSIGSDGLNALQTVTEAVKTLSDQDAIASANKGLTTVSNKTKDPSLKLALGELIN